MYDKAKEKLEKELKKAKDKAFAEPVIGHLLNRIAEDSGLAEDILQEHKTWEKCKSYLYDRARKMKSRNCAVVRDDTVYEWAEDYYRKDDKAEEEEKARKEAERKKKLEEEAKARKEKATEKAKAEVQPKPTEKPKKGEVEGQMSLFDMMNGGE